MELIKLNEAYNLTDSSELGWSSQGQVVKNTNGGIRINFHTNKKDEYVGTYNYDNFSTDTDVRINIASVKGLEDDYSKYCQEMVKQILEEVS